MNTSLRLLRQSLALFAILAGVNLSAQNSAFNYQGRLTDNAVSYTGTAEIKATLWNAPTGGEAVATNNPAQVLVNVANGLFNLPLEFGATPFTSGAPRWLQLEVRTSIGPFVLLAPRQSLTPTPYAITAQNLTGSLPASQLSGVLGSGQLSGDYSALVRLVNPANMFNGSYNGDGGGLDNVNATLLQGLPASRFWQLGGNVVTTNDFIGTASWGSPLDFKIGTQRAIRITSAGDAGSINNVCPSIIAGHWANDLVVNGGLVRGATIGGGGSFSAPNLISNFTTFCSIGGGLGNIISNYVDAGTIGGGWFNFAASDEATVAGGAMNKALGFSSTIGGGGGHRAEGFWSTIPGGRDNSATHYAFAAGRRAKADDPGSFVWADSQDADFSSTAADEFNIRAAGGVRIQSSRGIRLNMADAPMIVRDWDPFATNAPGDKAGMGRWGLFMEPYSLTIGIPAMGGRVFQVARYQTNGVYTQLMRVDQAGSLFTLGAINPPSDRDLKTNFAAVSPRQILERVALLPIQTWNYKADEAAARHIGPVAQDFEAAFSVGDDNKHIATVDADGVALAAIQGLNQKLEEQVQQKDTQIAELRREIEKLSQTVERLARRNPRP